MTTGVGNGIPDAAVGSGSGLVHLVGVGRGSPDAATGAATTDTRSGTPRSMAGTRTAGLSFTDYLSRRRGMLGTFNGTLNITSLLGRRRPMFGTNTNTLLNVSLLGRRRPLVGARNSSLAIESILQCVQLFPDTFHVPINHSEILLTAAIRGWHTPDTTFAWILKTVAGSGYEKILTPLVHSTKLVNMIPYGHYVVECTVNNGERRLHSNRYTILVDGESSNLPTYSFLTFGGRHLTWLGNNLKINL